MNETCPANKHHTILDFSQIIKIKWLTFTISKVLVLNKIVLFDTTFSDSALLNSTLLVTLISQPLKN